MKKKVKKFLIISVLGLLLINITFISSAIIIKAYGIFYLSPGEKYTVNIPFLGLSKNPTIHGMALTASGEGLSGVNVSVYYHGKSDPIKTVTTDGNGNYSITLPEIKSKQQYDINITYDNVSSLGDIKLGTNNYSLEFDDHETYKKSDKFATLSGRIFNEQALIENGRFEVSVRYYPTDSGSIQVQPYRTYYVNVDPEEVYEFPSDEMNATWEIPSDAQTGEYRFLMKTSFNGKERSSLYSYFTLTE